MSQSTYSIHFRLSCLNLFTVSISVQQNHIFNRELTGCSLKKEKSEPICVIIFAICKGQGDFKTDVCVPLGAQGCLPAGLGFRVLDKSEHIKP